MASMSKMFTAVATLQLVEQGKFRLDDTLGAVLPRYPSDERRSRITVRQLLQHTAGLGDMWSSARKPVPGLTGALAYAAAVAHEPLRFAPGSRWSYSNEGFAVLAAIVEEHGGMRFTDYLRTRVLAPAGMTETSIAAGADEHVPHRAVGYRPAPDDPLGAREPRANWSFLGATGAMGGAGGGYTTAMDLMRFGTALRDGTLLGAALRDSMWTGMWDIPGYAGEKYGFGSFTRRAGDRLVVGHGGGGTGSGMDNGFRMHADGRYTVVVLTNIDPPAATRVTEAIVGMTLASSTAARPADSPRDRRPARRATLH
jgi:CubicO group peptidase (beta-lactamase class C family)